MPLTKEWGGGSSQFCPPPHHRVQLPVGHSEGMLRFHQVSRQNRSRRLTFCARLQWDCRPRGLSGDVRMDGVGCPPTGVGSEEGGVQRKSKGGTVLEPEIYAGKMAQMHFCFGKCDPPRPPRGRALPPSSSGLSAGPVPPCFQPPHLHHPKKTPPTCTGKPPPGPCTSQRSFKPPDGGPQTPSVSLPRSALGLRPLPREQRSQMLPTRRVRGLAMPLTGQAPPPREVPNAHHHHPHGRMPPGAVPEGALQVSIRNRAQHPLGYLWTPSPVSTPPPPSPCPSPRLGRCAQHWSAVPSAFSSYPAEVGDKGNTRCARPTIVHR